MHVNRRPAAFDGICYIGGDKFVITKVRLQELLKESIWLESLDYRLTDLYPGRGEDPVIIAVSLVADLIDEAEG